MHGGSNLNTYMCLQVLTLEGWSVAQMYFYLDAVGYPFTVVFYVVLVLFGSLFALNLLTAIISAKVCFPLHTFVRTTEIALSCESDKHDTADRSVHLIAPGDTCADARPACERQEWNHVLWVLLQFSSIHGQHRRRLSSNDGAPWWDKVRVVKAVVHFVQPFIVSTHHSITSSNALKAWHLRMQPVQELVLLVVEHIYFQNIILAVIILNTFIMAIVYHGMPAKLADVLETVNAVFTWIFITEFILKHIAVGFRGAKC
jgi:hypothetical protein